MRTYLTAWIGLGLFTTIAGCATHQTPTHSSSAWELYKAFEQELAQNPEMPAYEDHLSADWVAMFNNTEDATERQQLLDFSAYPRWLAETGTYYQKPSSADLCLSVNGIAYDGSPGTIAVRYTSENGRLKATEIHYQYWETADEYPAEAQCPDDFGLMFPAEN